MTEVPSRRLVTSPARRRIPSCCDRGELSTPTRGCISLTECSPLDSTSSTRMRAGWPRALNSSALTSETGALSAASSAWSGMGLLDGSQSLQPDDRVRLLRSSSWSRGPGRTGPSGPARAPCRPDGGSGEGPAEGELGLPGAEELLGPQAGGHPQVRALAGQVGHRGPHPLDRVA